MKHTAMNRLGIDLNPWPWLPWYQRRWVHLPLAIILLLVALVMLCFLTVVHHENWMFPGIAFLAWADWHYHYRPDGRWRG